MALPQFVDHWKFRRLVQALGVGEVQSLGHCEFMWRAGCISGDPMLGDWLGVEGAARWSGEPGRLCKAMKESRLIDEIEAGIFIIHDFADHAPAYVRKRQKRHAVRKQNSREIRKNGNNYQCPATDQPLTSQRLPLTSQCPVSDEFSAPNGSTTNYQQPTTKEEEEGGVGDEQPKPQIREFSKTPFGIAERFCFHQIGRGMLKEDPRKVEESITAMVEAGICTLDEIDAEVRAPPGNGRERSETFAELKFRLKQRKKIASPPAASGRPQKASVFDHLESVDWSKPT